MEDPHAPGERHTERLPTRVRVRVPGKLNLFLAVRRRRPDGYHELISVMQTVSVYDTVTVRFEGTPLACLHPASRRFMELRFTHDAGAVVPDGEDNVAVRAARVLMAAIGAGSASAARPGADLPTTALHLEKRIPVAAGLAGGSADAAAALLALDRLWSVGLDRDELRRLAADLGADVPFCVSGGTALATGTGTVTAQVLCRGVFHWVLGASREPLATADVYRAYDRLCRPSDAEPDRVLGALRTGNAAALGAALCNSLEPATFHLQPELPGRRQALLEAGALGVVVSGTGPTLAGLAASAEQARDIADRVRDRFDRVEVAASPAGGPELV